DAASAPEEARAGGTCGGACHEGAVSTMVTKNGFGHEGHKGHRGKIFESFENSHTSAASTRAVCEAGRRAMRVSEERATDRNPAVVRSSLARIAAPLRGAASKFSLG